MNNLILFKKCNTCFEEKTINEFRKHSIAPDELKNTCKICDDKIAKLYYETHKEKQKASSRRWNHLHKEERAIYKREQRKKLRLQKSTIP